jgi:hypothetical protein
MKLILSILEFGDDPSAFELDGCLSEFELDNDDLSMFGEASSSEVDVKGPQGDKTKR